MNTLLVAKAIVEDGYVTKEFTREDFRVEIQKRAEATRKAGESPDQAFARFATTDPDGQVLMRAMRRAADSPTRGSYLEGRRPNTASLQPRVVSGPEAFRVNEPRSALALLNELVDRQCQLSPGRSREQLFADVYTTHPELAAQEREENRPTVSVLTKAEQVEREARRRAPRMATNEDVRREREEEEDGDALEALDRKAEENRRRDPKLSKAQAFAKAYADNPALAEAERAHNRPVPSAPNPYDRRG
jgi:hypothetical protein